MNIHILRSYQVGKDNSKFIFHIGFKWYDLGFQVHKWGLRIMLVWWHICIYFNPTN